MPKIVEKPELGLICRISGFIERDDSCYDVAMKTIILTDEAYKRLDERRESEHDSLSDVVLRVVPKRGTLADLLHSFQQLPPLTDEQAQVMQNTIAAANKWPTVDTLNFAEDAEVAAS